MKHWFKSFFKPVYYIEPSCMVIGYYKLYRINCGRHEYIKSADSREELNKIVQHALTPIVYYD